MRPSVFSYMADVATYRRAAEAASAHRALETRRTTGSVVLVP